MKAAAALLVMLVAVAAIASDTLTTTTGEKITGRVLRFQRNHSAAASSVFVIEVDGKEQSIPLHRLEEIAFDGAAPTDRVTSKPSRSATAPRASTPQKAVGPAPAAGSQSTAPRGGSFWLSSTGKRHNASCRYYGSGKGRSCGASDGVACKVCGG